MYDIESLEEKKHDKGVFVKIETKFAQNFIGSRKIIIFIYLTFNF